MLGQRPMGDFQPHRPSRRHLGNGGQPGIFQRRQQAPIEQPFQGQGNQFQQMMPRSPSVQGGGLRGMGGIPGGESRALGGAGIKGMPAKFLPEPEVQESLSRRWCGITRNPELRKPCEPFKHVRKCSKSTRNGAAIHAYDSAIRSFSQKFACHD